MKITYIAPEEVEWQNWNSFARPGSPLTEDVKEFKWSKFGEVQKGNCLYAGYENNTWGEDYPFLYLRFSLKNGRVTGVKRTLDCLDAVAAAWNDYDTPDFAIMGWASEYIREIQARRANNE